MINTTFVQCLALNIALLCYACTYLLGRYWEMVQRLKVNQFYTTPSAIRKLMQAGDEFVNNYDFSSLKTIGSGV